MAWCACYTTSSEAEAHLVRGFLEHRGVPCVLSIERLVAMYPGTGGPVQVLVPEEWLAVARKLVDRRSRREGGRGQRRGKVIPLAGRRRGSK